MRYASFAAALLLLSACDKAPTPQLDNPGTVISDVPSTASPPPEVVRTCESIRPDVIRVAGDNGVTIVKIYDPKTISAEPKHISCSGRALVSSGVEAKIYYRNFQDGDGDWLVQYAEQPFEK